MGTPPNLIGIAMIEKYCGVKIAFFQWMLFCVPLLVVLFIVLFVLMYYLHKPELAQIEGSHEYVALSAPHWGDGQRSEEFAHSLGVTVILWIIPGILAVMYGTGSPSQKHITSTCWRRARDRRCGLLFALPVNWKQREFTLTWGEQRR